MMVLDKNIRVVTIHPLETMNIFTRFCANPPRRYWIRDLMVGPEEKSEDQVIRIFQSGSKRRTGRLIDAAILGAMPLA